MTTRRLFSRSVCALLALPLAFTLSACSLKLSDGADGVTLEVEGPESVSLSTVTDQAMSSARAEENKQSSATSNKENGSSQQSATPNNTSKDAAPAPQAEEAGPPKDAEWYGDLTPEDFTDKVTILGGIATINDSNIKVRIDEPVDLLLIQGQNVKVVADEVGGLVINGQDVDVIAKSYGLVTLNGMNSNVVWTSKDDPQVINAGSNNTYRGAR